MAVPCLHVFAALYILLHCSAHTHMNTYTYTHEGAVLREL